MRPPPSKKDHTALRSHQIPRGMQHTFSSSMDTASTTNIPTRTISSTTAAVDKTASGAQRGWIIDVPTSKKDHRALRNYERQMEMLEEAKTKQAGALSAASSIANTADAASAAGGAAEATNHDVPGTLDWVLNFPPRRGMPR